MRTILIAQIFTLFIAQNSFSHPQFLNQLAGQFPKVLTTTKCMTCHSGSGLNDFGQDVAKFAFTPTGLDFSKVLDLDSNKNGISNRDELTRGTNPGTASQAP